MSAILCYPKYTSCPADMYKDTHLPFNIFLHVLPLRCSKWEKQKDGHAVLTKQWMCIFLIYIGRLLQNAFSIYVALWEAICWPAVTFGEYLGMLQDHR